MKKPVIGYLSGPVDAREVYEQWRDGQATTNFGTSYLQQFFSVATGLGAAGHVVTSHAGERYDVRCGDFQISNRPRVVRASGWRYHYEELKWTLRALRDMAASGSRAMLLTDAQNYWFLTWPWRLRGVKFVNSLHCVIRPAFKAEPGNLRVLLWLTGLLHYRYGDATICVSPLIKRQLSEMPGAEARSVEVFLPTYRPGHFDGIEPPSDQTGSTEVVVLSAGRVERNKGVFDLLDAAETLSSRQGPRVLFDICGEGTDLDALRAAAAKRGLDRIFRIHGFCDQNQIRERLGAADIVVVATRTDFEEGFAKIVAEGVIAGRPVVTSRVCPALEVVREACVEVEPDDPAAYADAIWALATDSELARQKRHATVALRDQFFDPANSYGAKLELALKVIVGERGSAHAS